MLSCDNQAEVWINGQPAGRSRAWESPVRADVQGLLRPGRNVIAVKGRNEGGVAGLVARLGAGRRDPVLAETGGGWKAASEVPDGWQQPDFDDSQWANAVVIASLGDAPWGNVFAAAPARNTGPGVVCAPEDLKLPEGFRAELLYVVPRDSQGSWVSLTLDDRQRLIAGDQDGGLYRIEIRDGAPPAVEALQTKVTQAQGLLHANGALYVVRNGNGNNGLYRLRDRDGDGQYEEEELLRAIDGGGEHGPHAVIAAPDGSGLYIVGGNHTKIPDPETSRVPRLWQEDQLLPRMPDANGHAANVMAPGGWICRTDWDGKSWELISIGYRNTYDIAFNHAGELFGYDADMEWDVGMPWYRPTRVCHAVPGSEFGWRHGSGKWPAYYPDSLPAVVDIGPGSPTGVLFGYGSKFPAKYQRALYILDWTFGTMYAVHLTPQGATWSGEKEEFVAGKPLPLTDAVIRPADGAMYFLVGGRRTQSALYRVTWAGGETPPADPEPELTPEMRLRRELEDLQTAAPSPEVVDRVWPALSHPDRFIRFAARTVLEFQPVALWKYRALAELNPDAAITSLLGLARAGSREDLERIVHALGRISWHSLSEEQQLALLRTYAVAFCRMGPPDDALKASLAARFDPLFPSQSAALNRELCAMLVYLDSRQVVAKAVALLAASADDSHDDLASADLLQRSDSYATDILKAQRSRPNRQLIAYAYALRAADTGWTPELYKQFFQWFVTAGKYEGGNSLRGFIQNMRKEAIALAPDSLRPELESVSAGLLAPPAELPTPKGPGRPWTIDEILSLTKDGIRNRDFANGQRTFHAVLCSSCHRFGNEGGGVGPDITGAGNRYTLRDLLENIIEPSKVISDQYHSTLIEKQDGTSIVGRIMQEEGDKIAIAQNPLAPHDLTVINQSDVKSRSVYPVSAMPPALLNSLNQDEVLDLLAYLLSAGNPEDPAFSGKEQ